MGREGGGDQRDHSCRFFRDVLQSFQYFPMNLLTLEALRRGGGQIDPPLDFFGFKFVLLGGLSKPLAQLFLVCENIF